MVLFGGVNSSHHEISETTLLLLGECTISATDLSTQASCCNIPPPHHSIAIYFSVQCLSCSFISDVLDLRKQSSCCNIPNYCVPTIWYVWHSISKLHKLPLHACIWNCCTASFYLEADSQTGRAICMYVVTARSLSKYFPSLCPCLLSSQSSLVQGRWSQSSWSGGCRTKVWAKILHTCTHTHA